MTTLKTDKARAGQDRPMVSRVLVISMILAVIVLFGALVYFA